MYFLITNPIFPYNVLVSYDEADKVLIDRLVMLGYTQIECEENIPMRASIDGRCIRTSKNEIIIRIKKITDKNKLMGIVAHESLHAVSFIMDMSGILFDTEISEEVYCYFLAYLVREINSKIT